MKLKNEISQKPYEDRLKYLYRLQELLRLQHNEKGQAFKDGKITEQEFRDFQKKWFRKRNLFLCSEINKCREKIPELKQEQLSNTTILSILNTYKESKKDGDLQTNLSDIEE